MIIVSPIRENVYEITRFNMQNGQPVPAIHMTNIYSEDMILYLVGEGCEREDIELAIKAFKRRNATAVTFKDNGQLSYILEA